MNKEARYWRCLGDRSMAERFTINHIYKVKSNGYMMDNVGYDWCCALNDNSPTWMIVVDWEEVSEDEYNNFINS